jgi:glycosyltransferase involved in cell wall biosynthesis
MLVSIIIPIYNAEKFLKKSIESAINQSYEEIELILVNDGSTDSSETICNEYALIDKRIEVISQGNKGPAAARNTGLRQATGNMVFFLDADDFIDNKTIELLAANYNQYQPDMVMGNFRKLENSGEVINQNVSFSPDNKPLSDENIVLSQKDIASYVRHFFKYPSNHLISYCWGRLYKLSVIKNNKIYAREDMRLFEDFVFNLEYLKYTNNIVFVNKPLYTYTMHNKHISASMVSISADSLLYDMGIFKEKANEFFQEKNANAAAGPDLENAIGHVLMHYTIIFLVRSSYRITRQNSKSIYKEFYKIVNAPIIRESLPCYSPSKGNSRVLPLLVSFKLIRLIMLVAKYKAYKRYGKISSKYAEERHRCGN